MDALTVAVPVLLGLGLFAGTFGSILGLGGSVIIVPVLTSLGFPPATAAATGLVCVITTSSSAASVYVGRGWVELRTAVLLQLATVSGSITGAWLAPYFPKLLFQSFFTVFLLYAAWLLWTRPAPALDEQPEAEYSRRIRNRAWGASGCFVAGNVSGLLGIGGGPITVPVMHLGMGLPVKIAAATSTFIMGMTATAGALLYYARGEMVMALSAPLALGVFLGAQLGARLARRVRSRTVQRLFIVVLLVLVLALLSDVLQSLVQAKGDGL